MIFRQLFDPETSSYTYLLAGQRGGEALLIDPVIGRVEQYLRLLGELELRLAKAIDTHLHADHVSAVGALRDRTRCVTAMGAKSPVDVVSMRLREGDAVEVEGVRLAVLETPGHTEDSCCLALEDRVFTGDTLLIRGTGRSDLPGGDPRAQYDSIARKLLTLPDDTFVYPGHDYKGETVSTIGEERAHNPRLRARSADEYAAVMGALRLDSPRQMDVALPANRRMGADQGEGQAWAVSAREAATLAPRSDVVFVDLREDAECERDGAIPGSLRAPYRDLPQLLAPGGLLRHAAAGRRILFYCAFGERSALAVATAREAGLANVAHLVGGLDAWRRCGERVVA